VSFSPALALYRGATASLGAFANVWLGARVRAGKEDGARLAERFGRYAQTRPIGRLVWLHAASVGESGVALALIEAMAARDPGLSFLISTGTRTSAELIARRGAKHVAHIYAPLDRADCVRRFLKHWRPDLGVFVESEIWPNLILAAERAGVRLALVNARMSPKTLARWKRWRAAGRRLAQAFSWISAADARTGAALSDLRGAPVATLGNLKLAAPAPKIDARAKEALAGEIGARPVWLAASTHEGEDEIILTAHAALRQTHPDALLILAPRHPERGVAIAELAGGAPRRSLFQSIGPASVYVADTLGEMGVLFDLAPVALIAGSLLPHLKGHNPIEPAKLGAAILSGPHVESFADVFAALFAGGGAERVDDAARIAASVAALWDDDARRAAQVKAARAFAAQGGEAFDTTVRQVLALAPQAVHAGGAHAPA
jgi:3-deoxy-D-manno-octulosonic-acid transferase